MTYGAQFAPAKVNLFLHVGPRDASGFHPVASLMSFADVGDRVSLSSGSRFAFKLQGALAEGLAGEDPARNLVVRAALKLFEKAGTSPAKVQLVLDKALPVAAGLGGGSSDAGAALRLLRDVLQLSVDDAGLGSIAAELGSDAPACLFGAPVVAQGRGDLLSPAPEMPLLPAVLVNPGVSCPTPAVYNRLDELAGETTADLPNLQRRYETVEDVATCLATCRNDLEGPAIDVAPQIDTVLSFLRREPETVLARLSGSGATAFALCADDAASRRLAARLAKLRPNWWVRACRLGGPWPATAGEVTKA